jgi:hypothetical protein
VAGSVEDLQAAVRQRGDDRGVGGPGGLRVVAAHTDQGRHRDRAKPRLQLSFTVGRRSPLGRLLWAMLATLARTTWWVGLLDLPAEDC